MRALIGLIGLAFALLIAGPAAAQTGTPAQAQTDCKTPGNSPVAGSYYSITTNLLRQTCVDASGGSAPSPAVVTTATTYVTIAAGGTAQNALAANANRKGWCITAIAGNTSTATIRPNGTATATVGTPLASNAQICNQPGTVDQTAISVFDATTGDHFSASEWQ